MLKKYRKINSLSVNDVVVELQDKYGVNVAEKTVYGWESNQAHPTSDVFVALCDIYKINNISDIFNSTRFCNSESAEISLIQFACSHSFSNFPKCFSGDKSVI